MCTENQHTEMGGNSSNNHLLLDYAWKWFDYHAKQRISMFNFFLIASGVLAHAYVTLVCKQSYDLAYRLAFIGALISFAFVLLDFRNAKLVYMGEDVLRRLERDVLFQQELRGLSEKDVEITPGILYRELKESKKGFLKYGQRFIKHKVWLRFIEIIIVICFGILSYKAWLLSDC